MMTENHALSYSTYLKVDELLKLQHPLSEGPEHDELLFIIIHQSYELWFKQLIHEFTAAQEALNDGESFKALALLGRIRTIIKICVSQVDILETMTPIQFNSFRERLGASSGFQSAQFREVEVILGRRDTRAISHLLPEDYERVFERMNQPSLWASMLNYLDKRGFQIPAEVLSQDPLTHYEPSKEIQDILVKVHLEDQEAAIVCERLVDIDEGFQEWRYRHVKMVERTIGQKIGTGGSAGAEYLRSTLFRPVFPDLWEIRTRF